MKNILPHVENIIQKQFIPSICEGRTCNDDERQILQLSVKLGVTNLTLISDIDYDSLKKVTKNLYRTSSHKKATKEIVCFNIGNIYLFNNCFQDTLNPLCDW